MLEEWLFARLQALGRPVYPMVAPSHAAMPVVTYQRISTPHTYHHGGQDVVTRPRFQVNVWAGSYLEAITLGRQVRDALSAADDGPVQAGFVDDVRQSRDTDTGRFRVMVDVLLWAEEGVTA